MHYLVIYNIAFPCDLPLHNQAKRYEKEQKTGGRISDMRGSTTSVCVLRDARWLDPLSQERGLRQRFAQPRQAL